VLRREPARCEGAHPLAAAVQAAESGSEEVKGSARSRTRHADDALFDRAVLEASRKTPYTEAVNAGWHPLAAVYHFATKDAQWVTPPERRAREAALVEKARTNPPPPPYKRTRGRGQRLPVDPRPGEFLDVLMGRRTWRGFGHSPIDPADLGTLLDVTFGVQMIGRAGKGVPALFKTSPSGGARHPVEAYVLAVRVKGLPRGLYHYSPRSRALHLVRRGASSSQLSSYLSGQTWFADAGVLVLMTAVLPRLYWRYEHPRAYRALLLEAGHVCQTFCLAATWLGLAPFCTMALDDSRIERDLGIDGVEEALIYAAGAGTRPADGRWVQWPRSPRRAASRRR
jgi:SagB-type dehydrogenase family enzyme